ncbi:pickpocket protein 11 [Drosophila innubila]|uniref:pickpocket protein 11 n=1 Tax=Drosophila innubila TaxID=198719 RepID=UPI00148B5E73|nr:pickpocket protein 11 [Drosophila innubila]
MSIKNPEQLIYLINFEDYLRPKRPHKSTPLQCFDNPKKSKTKCYKLYKRLKLVRWLQEMQTKLSKRLEQVPLPGFLGFLRERNDDGLCKPKTGFEIYCEMSSIHGFHLFVGAKTWQRVLWWIFICTALILSLLVVIMSHGMTANTPTIRLIESMMQPRAEQSIPFPAVTICSLNRVAKRRLLIKAKEWNVEKETLQQLPWLTSRRLDPINATLLSSLSLGNSTWSQLLEQLSPQLCESQLLDCKWQGQNQSCNELFATTWSVSEGRCCSFRSQPKNALFLKGLTIRLAAMLEDYGSTLAVTAGFQLLIHEAESTIDAATQRVFLPRGTESQLMVKAFRTHASSYLGNLPIDKRRCYLTHERKMFHFSNYSQDNCLAECRSARIYQICGCVHPHMPSRRDWPLCQVEQFKCLQEQNFSWKDLQMNCNCLPTCQFSRYEVHSDVANLDATHPMPYTNNGFFNNLNVSDDLILHIYFDSMSAEQLRLDVFENWLTFIGKYSQTAL